MGRWEVMLHDFERIALPTLSSPTTRSTGGVAPMPHLVVIDEIGKMELFSKRFTRAVETLVKDPSIFILATIPLKHRIQLVERLKTRSDSTVWCLNRDNRNSSFDIIHKFIVNTLP